VKRAGLLVVVALAGCVVDSTYAVCADATDCDAEDTCVRAETDRTTGSLCTASCEVDLDCQSGRLGAACLQAGAGRFCFLVCESDLDCFLGSLCVDVGGTGVCAPDDGGGGSGGGQTYAPCLRAGSCGAEEACTEVDARRTLGLYGAMCTTGCTADEDCRGRDGNAGACADVTGVPLCHQECAVTADCPSEQTCVGVSGRVNGICVPDDPLYRACLPELDECGLETCVTIDVLSGGGDSFGALCTRSCVDDTECPPIGANPAVCVFPPGSAVTSQCLATCMSDDDCHLDTVCRDIGFPDRVCVPDNFE
jgi:hypothetical protein